MKFNRIRSKIADELELPDSSMSGNFDIRIKGNKKVIIENHVAVLVYESDIIHIKTKVQSVLIRGLKLRIEEITEHYSTVTGIINSVEIKG